MTSVTSSEAVTVFSTCPPSNTVPRDEYAAMVVEVARRSEAAGCAGILVYTDNGLLDPWLVAQLIIQHTARLCPLVAVQPVYAHPYTIAKLVTSIAHLHGRRIYLNMVAGGFKNDLAALDDRTPHDERYDRLIEYTSIIDALLAGEGAVTFRGRYYNVENLRMTPPLAPELRPGVFVSGSSEAGVAAARRLGATAVQYPKPPGEYQGQAVPDGLAAGVRIGIIARGDADLAWQVARARFPEDRKGRLTHQLAMKVSDSAWHRQLSALGRSPATEAHPYWMVPFENYKTFCPYLVGSYDRVAEELCRYTAVGYRTFILDVPAAADDLFHSGIAFERAMRRAVA